MDLVAFLSSVPDFRSDQGKRYPLSHILLMMIFALMNNQRSYRKMATFMHKNALLLCKVLDISPDSIHYGSTPSYGTLKIILSYLATVPLEALFNQYSTLNKEDFEYQFVTLDGKWLSSAVDANDPESSAQNGSYVVSAYLPDSGQVIGHKSADTKQCSETTTLRELLEQLALRLALLSVDAGHFSKKL